MVYGKRTLQILGCISLILLVTSVAQAGVVAETTPFVGTDGTTWNIGPFSNNLGECVGAANLCATPWGTIAHPVVTSGNSLLISFSQSPGTQDGLVDQQNSSIGANLFDGGFGVNDYLLDSNDTLAPHSPPDSLTITFANPVAEFGLYIEEADFGNGFNATITNTGTDGTATYTTAGGTDIQWVGLQDTTASITSVTITTTSTSGGQSGYFFVDTAQFNDTGNGTITGPVPEPGSILLMAGGIAVLGWKARKRARA